MILRRIFLLIVILSLAGCEGLTLPEPSPTVESSPAVTPTVQPPPNDTPTPSGPVTLTLWLPPEFDPESGTPAGEILKARLNEFSARRPNARVEVRIKALDGPGGLLDSLSTASAAAPLALPDLVALPRPTLEVAALKGLLHPFDELTDSIDNSDWYDYARQLARVQNSTFGLPFAGDAMIMVYRTTLISEPPHTLTTTLTTRGPLAFPAADPQALFPLALYQAYGGKIQDDQGRPFLETDSLAEVLTFFQEAEKTGLTPFWLTQYQTDDQSWEAFTENRADMAITWASRYLKEMTADTNAAPLPTPDGVPSTLATGWVWALASSNPEHLLLSAQLAEFLSESNFLAQWNTASGYLPPRPSALAAWQDTTSQALAGQVMSSARLYPSADILTSLAPPINQALTAILKQQTDPLSAAQDAVSSLAKP